MKLILSRKGMDSSAGGLPSPILPDGRLCPLPIPDPCAPACYADLRLGGQPGGPLLAALGAGRVGPRTRAHLDPDLDPAARPRPGGFVPLFGQAGSAQAHLAGRGVGCGDVFLFFGWFRATAWRDGRLAYVRDAPHLHVLFGWLQVAQVLAVADPRAAALPGVREHPHFHGERGRHNTVYVGAERLQLPGLPDRSRPGAGLLRHLRSELVLTADPESGRRSEWRLPDWFWPVGAARPRLSHHEDACRWSREGRWLRLRSVGRGQEFVLAPEDPLRAARWIDALVSSVGAQA